MATNNANSCESGEFDLKNPNTRIWFNGSGHPAHSNEHQDVATPVYPPDEDVLVMANQRIIRGMIQIFDGSPGLSATGNGEPDPNLQHGSVSGASEDLSSAPRLALQAPGRDTLSEHQIPGPHASLSSSPTSKYQHHFSSQAEISGTAEVDNTEWPPSFESSDGQAARPGDRSTPPGDGSTPQASSLDEGGFNDQRRVDMFLKDHRVPRNWRSDPTSTLLEWVAIKMKESQDKDEEIGRQAMELDTHSRDLEKLERLLTASQGSWVKTQQQQEAVLKRAYVKISSLRGDLESSCVSVLAAQQMLNNIVAGRDQAEHSLEEVERKLVETHKKIFDTTEKLEEAENNYALVIKDAIKDAQEMAKLHEVSLADLQKKHDEAFLQQDAILEELRQHMSNYSIPGGYAAISDDMFWDHFQLLTRRIDDLVDRVPRPSTYTMDQSLDSISFLARNALRGVSDWKWREFVRSLFWRSLERGLFSRQLGFGVLGHAGKGYDELDRLCKLFAARGYQYASDLPTPLPNNTKEHNSWRASFFDSMATTIRSSVVGQQQDSKYVRFFRINVHTVTQDLISSLRGAAKLHFHQEFFDDVAGLVEGVGLLALDMASQRAHMYLETCEHGETQVCKHFRDDTGLGDENLTVDIMTQPCLRRVGDGYDDLTTSTVILKGEFIAL